MAGTVVEHEVVVMGVPFDAHSSFQRGPALAPERIRQVLHSGMGNWSAEDGTDLEKVDGWRDIGDLALAGTPEPMALVERAAREIVEAGARLLAIGGDHSITYPLLAAQAPRHAGLTILHIDAHPDLYADFDGNVHSHASPFARIMERGLARRLIQVGIRTMNSHQREQAERFGVEVIAMRDFRPRMQLHLEAPLYISLDLDALDPAFAPGVSHHEPGGLSVRDVLHLLRQIEVPVIGTDLVEYNPLQDEGDRTAAVGAKFYKEMVALLLRSTTT